MDPIFFKPPKFRPKPRRPRPRPLAPMLRGGPAFERFFGGYFQAKDDFDDSSEDEFWWDNENHVCDEKVKVINMFPS